MLNFTLEDLQNALGGALNATSNAVTTTIGAPATFANYMFGGSAAVNAVAPLPAGFIDPATTCDAAFTPVADAAPMGPAVAEASSYASEYANWVMGGATTLVTGAVGLFWKHRNTVAMAAEMVKIDDVVANLVKDEAVRKDLSKAARQVIATLKDEKDVDFTQLAQSEAFRKLSDASLQLFSKLSAEARVEFVNGIVTPAVNAAFDAAKKALLVHYKDDAGYVGFIDGLQQSSIRLINDMSIDKLSSLKNNLLANAAQGGKIWENLTNERMVNAFIDGFKSKATVRPN